MEKNSARAWAASLIMTAACVAVYMTQNKYSPAVSQLMEYFDISLTQSSLLMSVFGIVAIIIALPGGGLAAKYGAKNVTVVGLCSLILGGIIGALSPSYVVLLVGRCVEAVGRAILIVCAPTIISLLFTKDKLGLPMGIQAAWAAIGGIIILNFASLVVPSFGWKGLWWSVVIIDAIVLALVWFFVPNDRDMAAANQEEVSEKVEETKVKITSVLKNPAVWLLGIIMAGFTMTGGSINTYGPAYLKQACGYGEAQANLMASVYPAGKIIGAIVVGAIMLRWRNKNSLLTIVMAATAVLSFFIYQFTPDTSKGFVVAYLLLTGCLLCGIPACIYAIAPEIMENKLAVGAAMGIIVFIQNVVNTIYPPLVTGVVDASGGDWSAAAWPCFIASLIAVCCAVALLLMDRAKKNKAKAAEPAATAAE